MEYILLQLFLVKNPCETTEEEEKQCCNKWTKNIGNNLKSIMKVMRFANHRGRSSFDLESIIPNATNKLGYALENLFWSSGRTTKLDLTTMIPTCYMENIDENTDMKQFFREKSCQLFQPVFTDLGMCHSFNPTPVLDLLKESYFTNSFYEAFKDDLMPNENLHMGTKSGDALHFYLIGNYRHRQINIESTKSDKDFPTKFLFSLSSKDDYFGMKESRKIIRSGYKVTWNVQAMEIVPSDDLRDISIESRKCRFDDEINGLDFFKSYSQSACEFELKVRKGREVCNCVPWYIPSNSTSRHNICDVYGNFCFNQVQQQYQLSKECLPGCHQIQFTSYEVQEKLDPEVLCDPMRRTFENRLTDTFQTNTDQKVTSLLYEIQTLQDWILQNNKFNESYDLNKIKNKACKRLLEKDLAEVVVKFERKKFIRTLTSKRVTFPDKLGAFGKMQFQIINPNNQ